MDSRETSIYVRNIFENSILIGTVPTQLTLGYDIVITVDFYNMGVEIVKMVLENRCDQKIEKTLLLINYDRLKEYWPRR
jgi:hypothetical protein